MEYQVSEQRKQLWDVELRLTDILLDICRKNNLKIWACYGTLLGVVRHKGFIPWDDDVDFVMMRDDYDRFTGLIESSLIEIPEGYEFDIEDISVIKLRNANTTMLHPRYRWSKDIKQGIWIDVFCLDVAPDELSPDLPRYYGLQKKIRMYRNYRLGYYAMVPSLRYSLGHFAIKIYFLFHKSSKHRQAIEDELRKDAQRYSGSKVWGFLIWSIIKGADKVVPYDSSWFEETVLMPFEDRMLPCPIGWEQILTVQYGDWRTPVMGGSQHEGSYVDINKPYSTYIAEELKKMPLWKRYGYKH